MNKTIYDEFCEFTLSKDFDNLDSNSKSKLMFLLEKMEKNYYSQSIIEKAYCLGFINGASNQVGKKYITDNIANNIKTTWENNKQHILK